MITLIRTVTAAPDKLFDTLAWGKEIAAIIKRVTDKDIAVASPFGWAVTDVAWIAQWDSVAQADEAFVKLLADREYTAALARGTQLVVAGSAHDHIWKHI